METCCSTPQAGFPGFYGLNNLISVFAITASFDSLNELRGLPDVHPGILFLFNIESVQVVIRMISFHAEIINIAGRFFEVDVAAIVKVTINLLMCILVLNNRKAHLAQQIETKMKCGVVSSAYGRSKVGRISSIFSKPFG